MSNIFISYRRDDSSGHVGRLHEWLTERYDPDQVFMDIDRIAPGQDFVEAITAAISQSAVVVAVIGRQWLTLGAPGGGRRIDSESDFVHLELFAAITKGLPIVPVLVQGARMPGPDELPARLAPLARRQACELSDTRWKHDIEVLLDVLGKIAAPAGGSKGAVHTWPASEAGLAGITKAILDEIRNARQDEAAALLSTFVLPEHDDWFRSVFGPDVGARLALEYSRGTRRMVFELHKLFSECIAQQRTIVAAHRVTREDAEHATGLQQAALEKMLTPVPLYSVDIVAPGDEHGMHLWSFVHVDGNFRLIGKLRGLRDVPDAYARA